MRPTIALAMMLFSSFAYCQEIVIHATPSRSVTVEGAKFVVAPDGKSAKIYGDGAVKVLPDVDINLDSPFKNHLVKARKIVVVSGQEFISGASVPVVKVSEKLYSISGDGKYRIEVIGSDPGLSFAETEIVVGPTPQPEPVDPPKPDVVVPNEYNLGKLVYSSAPNDADLAKKIAALYRYGANRLYGNGAPGGTIEAILAEIKSKFDARQCRDEATCKLWGDWKAKLDPALIAEQNRRRFFTTKDWYAAFTEIAIALEAVK